MSNKLYPLVPVGYLLLGIILSLLGNSLSFLLVFGCYALLVKVISLWVEREKRRRFFNIVFVFLLVYSVWSVLGQVVFINDPFTDFYVNLDEHKFFTYATNLSRYGVLDIWHIAFSEFVYSDKPLFDALNGTLLKLSGLSGFWGEMFLRLNVAFFGSFIPGIVYLLCTSIIGTQKTFRLAMIYGFFSITFFYSVGLMRDIHIALIYAIGFYILIVKKYSIKNIGVLAILGVLAYYLRFENGLFFFAFVGAFILKSDQKKSGLIAVASLIGLVLIVYFIGGFNSIFGSATNTIAHYSEAQEKYIGTDSLGVKLMSLPPPLNWVMVAGFNQITPFPFWATFDNSLTVLKNIFYLPVVVAGLFWFSVWVSILRGFSKIKTFFKKYKYACLIALLYLVLVSISQGLGRRLMAVYPMIFMGYAYVIEHSKFKGILFKVLIYAILILIYFALKVVL